MPTIESLEIENYRSFGTNRQSIKLGKRVTVLIGPNNSGKSNVLRALRLALQTKAQSGCRPDDVNVTARERAQVEELDREKKVASIAVKCNFNDSDRERCINAMRLYFDSLARNNALPTITSEDWVLISEVLESIWEKIFASGVSVSVDMVRKRDLNYEIEPSRANYGRKWTTQNPEDFDSLMKLVKDGALHVAIRTHGVDRFIEAMLDVVTPDVNLMSREIPPEDPVKSEGYSQLDNSPVSPQNLRNYLLIMSDEKDAPQYQEVYSFLKESILKSFDDIDEMTPRFDKWYNKPEVLFKKGSLEYELGSQGDGIKHMLMFYTLLHTNRDALLVVDEPENHLHPSLETRLVEYFLEYGEGQLVMATHSDVIVSSIPEEKLQSGDVAIYGVGLDDANRTFVKQASDTQIIKILKGIGVPITRYQLQMAALSKTILFVEGKTDVEIIEETLRRFGEEARLIECQPYYIPYGEIGRASIFASAVIDAIRKTENTIGTPRTPYIVIKDRDEDDAASTDNTESDSRIFVWSVREAENLFLSKESIMGVVKAFFDRTGITATDDNIRVFEENLLAQVTGYLPKWIILRFRRRIGKVLRPLWESIKVVSLEDVESEINETIDDFKKKADVEVTRAEGLVDEQENLRAECTSDEGALNFEFVTQNLPGKDLIKLIQRAMVDAVVEIGVSIERDKLSSEAGQVTSYKDFIEKSTDFHSDFESLLLRLQQMQQ